MRLKEVQEKFHIHRIDFSKVEPSDHVEQHGCDQLICPYCGSVNEYESDEIDEILTGTPWLCAHCGKYFFAEGEATINTTCTLIENKVLEPTTRRIIEDDYEYMDVCEKNCGWSDRPYGGLEYVTYKRYAEPLFSNEKSKEKIKENIHGCPDSGHNADPAVEADGERLIDLVMHTTQDSEEYILNLACLADYGPQFEKYADTCDQYFTCEECWKQKICNNQKGE